ncbi:MAG: hypothetical protein KF893_17530 [Caldilineaceae bacterium]|nr:hypothetical protein [Caldilineaceae bacterium]
MTISKKLAALQEAYSQAELHPILDRLLAEKLAEYRERLSEYEFDLRTFEERYGVKSAELYDQFESGQRGDAKEFLEWLGIYDHYLRLSGRIERIESVLNEAVHNS